MSLIEAQGVALRYGGPSGTLALDSFWLSVEPGEFVALVGPSGCGKTTLMRIVAGIERADSGTVSIAGRDVTDLRAADRDVAMVFQSYALYPHMTVEENLTYSLRIRGTPKAEAKKAVAAGAKCGFTPQWQTWTMIENYGAWHNLPYATKDNGFGGTDIELKFNDPARVKFIQMLADWSKDKTFVYGGREGKSTALFTAGECVFHIASSATALLTRPSGAAPPAMPVSPNALS